jgi:hypothetical protein
MTTMAGAPGGPAVMMILVYIVLGADLIQSRTWRNRDGVVARSKTLRYSISASPIEDENSLYQISRIY